MEDSNTWECSVCTFHNSAEAFKCNMCDVRKGTSTRKPRINPEVVAKQVARQQEQIKQQALKSAVKVKPGTDGKISRRMEDTNSNSSIASTSSSGRNSPTANGSICSSNSIDTAISSSSFFDKINSLNNTASSSKALNMPSSSRNSVNANDSEEEVDENEEVDGKGNIGTAPARNGKAGRRARTIPSKARLKNVDRDDVEIKEVTCHNITVLITEFKVKKRKLSEVSENQFTPESPPKKTKESTPKNGSPEKGTSKEGGSVPSNRSKSSTSEAKKSPNKGANKGSKSEEEPLTKKRSSNSADSVEHHSSSSKKLASVTDN